MKKHRMNTDAIYRDFKKLQKLKWNWSEGKFDQIELLRYEEVRRRVADPNDEEQLLEALFDLLGETRDQLKRREESEDGTVNSVAKAAGILLRLDNKNDRRSVKALQEAAGRIWTGDNGEPIAGGTVRLSYEKDHMLRPFARELLVFLDRSSLPDGSEIGAENLGKEEGMLKHLRQVEEDRLRSIPQEGMLEVRTDEEMLEVLRGVNNLATESLHAVDRTPIEHWFQEPPLRDYLKQQLELVSEKDLFLERIYLVRRSTLQNEVKRNYLIEFIRWHEDVSATVLLCRVEMAKNDFDEERGLILADGEGEPLMVTGKLKDGEIGDAFLYTREQVRVKKTRDQYGKLRSRILTHEYDDKLRKTLGLEVKARGTDVH